VSYYESNIFIDVKFYEPRNFQKMFFKRCMIVQYTGHTQTLHDHVFVYSIFFFFSVFVFESLKKIINFKNLDILHGLLFFYSKIHERYIKRPLYMHWLCKKALLHFLTPCKAPLHAGTNCRPHFHYMWRVLRPHFHYMWRVLPKLMPVCEAPLLEPYCRLTIPSEARSCCSENSRTFFVDSLGPIDGWLKFEPFLPRACRQITTEFRFCLSQRSTV